MASLSLSLTLVSEHGCPLLPPVVVEPGQEHPLTAGVDVAPEGVYRSHGFTQGAGHVAGDTRDNQDLGPQRREHS